MAPKKKTKFHQPHFSMPISLCHQEELAALFNKKFTLKTSSDDWSLPNSDVLFSDKPFVIGNMLEIKRELNKTKSLLNDQDINEWHQHTRRTNKAGLVVQHLRSTLHPEMCTQAWAKFHEIINTHNVIPERALTDKRFNTVHLCEAPGAFITSLNQFLKCRKSNLRWQWLATTLNPYYEGHGLGAMLDDDRFISQTLQHWNFGKDSTGDLMNRDNVYSLQSSCQALGPIHLVTADGSIDCADQPAEQENIVAQLVYCEAVTAITLLTRGGNFVFKMFTALEHRMICLLYLLSCAFSEVYFIKPGTSKAGNSEVYVVCCGFKSIELLPKGYILKLMEAFNADSPSCAMIPLSEIPQDFLSRLWDCEQYFTNLQRDAILKNLQSYEHMSHSDEQSLKQLRHLVAIDYVDRFSVIAVGKEEFIVPNSNLDSNQSSYTQSTSTKRQNNQKFEGCHHVGSYNDRHSKSHANWLEEVILSSFAPDLSQPLSLEGLTLSKNGDQLVPLTPDQVEWLQSAHVPLTAEIVRQWQPLNGKTIDKVRNSHFCASTYVKFRDECLGKATILHQESLSALQRISHQIFPFNVTCDRNCTEQEVAALHSLVNLLDTKCDSFAVNVGTASSGIELFLQKENFKVHHIQCSNLEDLCVMSSSWLVFGNIQLLNNNAKTYSCCSDELKTKQELLKMLIAAMKLLKIGGTFICHMSELLLRFTTGLVYILHCLFTDIAVVKPFVSRLWHPDRYLICKGFQGCGKHILNYLVAVHSKMVELAACSDGSEDVLEIVPMKHLYEQRFFKFIKQSNEKIAHLQIQNIIRLEREFLTSHSC